MLPLKITKSDPAVGQAGDLVAIFRPGVKLTGASKTVKMFFSGRGNAPTQKGVSDRQIGKLIVRPHQFERFPFGQKA